MQFDDVADVVTGAASGLGAATAGALASDPSPLRIVVNCAGVAPSSRILEHDYLNGEVIRMDGALRMAPR